MVHAGDCVDVEHKAAQRPENVGAKSRAQRIPLGKNDQADGDPALPGSGQLAEPARGNGQADRRTG